MRILWGLLKLAALLATLAAVAAAAAFLTIQMVTTTKFVEVPDLLGLAPADATRRLDALDLRVQFDEDERNSFDDRVPAGHVLRQDPAPGTRLKQDRKVRVAISLGPRNLYVPRVVGETVTSAQMRLQEAGIRVGDVVYVPTPLAVESSIVDQQPTHLGQQGDPYTNLLVSQGTAPARYVMPDVIAKPVLRAQALFENAGFRVRVESERYEGVAEGTVIRQKPLAGGPIRAGDGITLWASRSASGGR